MERTAVRSSNVRSVGYTGGILEVEFHSGSVYQGRVPSCGVADQRDVVLVVLGSAGAHSGARWACVQR
ncbi:KTSC domain-containing protein [Streptomyces sp. NBC_00151]|uniref:KTSC domain-containing protein n=1 Tax=Streptomyces sp. NBC_00151 TaxID=2975669 RepID=UPI002DDC5FB4|nr:KTSC domain-containing protein [Streptomyces sp. NBC_00151]WRZ44634.1 KTSC domain-containing protein [Streptomyces sp. NBC_00151]